jgi:hypothetical protein
MRTIEQIRFSVITLFLAGLCALIGGVLIYDAVEAWYVGSFHTRRGVVQSATFPFRFAFTVISGAVSGVILIVCSVMLGRRSFATPEEQARTASSNQRIYGKVRARPFFLGAFLALLAFVVIVVLFGAYMKSN